MDTKNRTSDTYSAPGYDGPVPPPLPPGGLPTITPAQSAAVAQHFQHITTTTLNGYVLPGDPAGIAAGSMAVANQLALNLQNGTITQAQFDSAMASLTPTTF